MLLAAAVAASACSSGSKHAADTTAAAKSRVSHARVKRSHPVDLVERALAPLPQPLQDAAAARNGTGALVAGGLDAADASVGQIRFVSPHGDSKRGSLTSVRHDAAAATVGRTTYVFGGGDAIHQFDEIVAVGGNGRARVVGHLPQPASDVAAAAIGGTA